MAFGRLIRSHWPNTSREQMYALLTRFSQASSALAAQDYTARRAESGVRSQFTVPHAAAPSVDHFARTLNWVYDDPAASEDRMVAVMTRLAAQAGRETVVVAVKTDPQARAWARETRGDCCYFCALMAARGAVYASKSAAGADANARFTGDGAFKFHNNCHCIAVPVFGVYEKPADARGWNRQYNDLRRELGRSPSLLEWRQRFDSPAAIAAPTDVPQLAGN